MLTKLVDGVRMECTPEEEAAIRAEWEVNAERPEPVPSKISLRQMLIQASSEGWFTKLEAKAWAKREALPDAVLTIIGALPADQQADAEITALAMTEVTRDDRLIAAAATLFLPDATQAERDAATDDLFRAAAAR